MGKYKTRPGVVLTTVCGESLLVSAKAVREYCPYVTTLNDSSAFLWKQLKAGAGEAELKAAVLDEYELEDPGQLDGMIREFLDEMLKMNYLIKTGEED